jgi:hypothetical protein
MQRRFFAQTDDTTGSVSVCKIAPTFKLVIGGTCEAVRSAGEGV